MISHSILQHDRLWYKVDSVGPRVVRAAHGEAKTVRRARRINHLSFIVDRYDGRIILQFSLGRHLAPNFEIKY